MTLRNLKQEILLMGKQAKEASHLMLETSLTLRNKALALIAQELKKKRALIIGENRKDLKIAQNKGLSSAFLDRLRLDNRDLQKMAEMVREVKRLPDPLGKPLWEIKRPNGLLIKRVSVPIGVIAIVYESRPDVTVQAATLCLKSGNSVLLKGGREAHFSNLILTHILQRAIKRCGLPEYGIQIVKSTERRAVKYILSLSNCIDLIIPRGGESLIKMVSSNSRIPVIKHYKGVCHTYVDKKASLEKAVSITYNSKIQRPGTCNSTETLLVHRKVAPSFLPEIINKLKSARCEIRGCQKTLKIYPGIKKAKMEDWSTEYLDKILSVKVVDSLKEAIEHINLYGTHHSDSIITKDKKRGEEFLKRVDSAAVYLNSSTRFTDGNEFGLGAEIGISTDKIHARGPMGLESLTSYKYIIYGNGQIRK
ncbi:MAG: glutamate-5-semialdehyde dehydrogenase [Candidatus Omnitrophica bacterium]|nr:glutamate-5-semialdehyde dehydrogenase [Candidatus Omnitrophota bacterium]